MLYIGQTDNLANRIGDYKERNVKGFATKYNADTLVWYDTFETREEACLTEKRMKVWKRDWKIQLIETDNPDWDDLYLKIDLLDFEHH